MPPPNRSEAAINRAAAAGERRAPRKRRTLCIECRGPGGLRVDARTIDVSRGGTLIEVADPMIFSAERPSPFADRAEEIRSLFPEGVDVSFGEGAVLAFARIVRCVATPDRPDHVLLGCKFEPALSPVDCRLLGIDFGGDETGDTDVAGSLKALRRDGDDLVVFIDSPNRVWSEPEGPTDSSPVLARPAAPEAAPSQTSDARPIVYVEKISSTELVARPHVPPADRLQATEIDVGPTAVPARPSSHEHPSSPMPATTPAPTPAALPATAAAGEGLTDDEFRQVGRERARVAHAAVPGKAAEWAGVGAVVVYLFPAMAGALAPRYHGRVEQLDEHNVVVDLPVPAGDVDPIGHGAGLGGSVRAVFVRDGHVLGEASCEVVRLDVNAASGVRAALRPTTKLVKALLEPARHAKE